MRALVIYIKFIASIKAQLVISILDFEGEEVSKNILRASYKKLEAKLFETRRFTITAKNGTDALGRNVSAGMYFYLLQAGDFRQVNKMILLK